MPKLLVIFSSHTLCEVIGHNHIAEAYLGVELSNDFSWSKHISQTVNSANKAPWIIEKELILLRKLHTNLLSGQKLHFLWNHAKLCSRPR